MKEESKPSEDSRCEDVERKAEPKKENARKGSKAVATGKAAAAEKSEKSAKFWDRFYKLHFG
jgi:hypothetical protein